MKIYKRTAKPKRMLFLAALLFLITILASVHPVFSEDDRAVADEKRAQAAELRKQAAEKEALIAQKDEEIRPLREEKNKTDSEIYELEKEIIQQKRERDSLTLQIKPMQDRWNQLEEEYKALNKEYYGDPAYAGRSGIKNEAGGPISEIKNNLDTAADGLDDVVDILKRAGLSDEEVNKLINTVGVDPRQLANELRQTANNIPGGSMSLAELERWYNELSVEYTKALGQQARVRGSDYDELKRQVDEYDSEIRKEEAQVRFWKSEMEKHNDNAEELWEPCAEVAKPKDFFGFLGSLGSCIWNMPGLVHEKVLAPAVNWLNLVLGAEERIKQLRSLRSIPAGRIMLADAAAAPYTFTVGILEKQMDAVATAKVEVRKKISERLDKVREEAKKLDDEATPLVNRRNSINEAIKPVEEKIKPLKNKSDDLEQQMRNLANERAEIFQQYSALLGQAVALETAAAEIEATTAARAGEPCNPGIPMYQQPGCVENATPSRSAWDGLPCPGPSVPEYAQAGCIPQ